MSDKPLEQEYKTYNRIHHTLLNDIGKFIAIREDRVFGIFDTYEEAFKSVHTRNPFGIFLVKQIGALPIKPVYIDANRNVVKD